MICPFFKTKNNIFQLYTIEDVYKNMYLTKIDLCELGISFKEMFNNCTVFIEYQ